MRIGYARLQSKSQSLDAQLDLLKENSCEDIYSEYGSGSLDELPELTKCLEKLQAGDTFVVCKLDRLCSSMDHTVDLLQKLDAANIGFISILDHLSTEDPEGRNRLHSFIGLTKFGMSVR